MTRPASPVLNGNEGIEIHKAAGKLGILAAELVGHEPTGTTGMGHTRWATHGGPTTINAHPHLDQSGRIALIHNGIIENANAIKKALLARGHTFLSETDTEVLAHLIGELYEGSLEEAVAAALRDVDGAYGIVVVSADEPGVLVTARNGSPIIIGIGDGENLVASDQSALLDHTRSVVYLDNGEMAILTADGYRVRTLTTRQVDKPVNQIEWDLATIERGGFDHFMLKEIFEQPDSIENTMRGHLLEETGNVRVYGLKLSDTDAKKVKRIIITACGTSWHSALIGKSMIEELARIPTDVEYASEFRYRNPIVDAETLVIAISQSGETADTLAALLEAKQRGARVLGLVNVVGSTISREVHGGMYLRCGPEIGVASTKAFTSQVVALAMVTIRFARLRTMSLLEGRRYIEALHKIPAQVQQVLERAGEIEALASRFEGSTNALYLGRGVNFPVATRRRAQAQGNFVHSRGRLSGRRDEARADRADRREHAGGGGGATRRRARQDRLEHPGSARARRQDHRDRQPRRRGDFAPCPRATFIVPETLDLLTPILTVIPLQLLSYYVAVNRGCNVDQPRNLAKSVTVE